MGKNRRTYKNNMKKERMIMIGSSVFVLTALTLTGIYMSRDDMESKDNGYIVDFTALEDNANQLAQNYTTDLNQDIQDFDPVLEDDLDYMPYEMDNLELGTTEVGSGQVEISGLTEKEEVPEDEVGVSAGEEEQLPTSTATVRELHFSEENGLLRPVDGEVLIHYSMSQSVYFATLDQYKYNPAVVLDAEEGTSVDVCAAGQVVSVFENEEIGRAVTLDLGDGYRATYGQLQNIRVSENDYVDAGDVLGTVATPTKYYSVEGSNVYFMLTKDGAPVNPEELF